MKKIIYTLCILLFCSAQYAIAQNVNIPDAAFKAILVGDPNINTNSDGEIQVSEAEAYTGGIGDGLGRVSDATGIGAFVNITGVEFDYCTISSLDLSNNTKLGSIRISDCPVTTLMLPATATLLSLYCWNTSLTSIDVSQNPALYSFYCGVSNVTSIDVSHNPALTLFNCYSNALTSLNVKNGHNELLTLFYARNNPNLTCIQVDDPAYMDAHWASSKDATASFNANCGGVEPIVNIPDANFKAALVGNTSINTNADDEIQVSEANAYAGTINVSNNGINDLTGIEAFTNIQQLDCSNNNLTTLDVSANSNLRGLYCINNHLTTLDVSANTNLEVLYCSNNHLTGLNVSSNIILNSLDCAYNQIDNLDVSHNNNLAVLGCSDNLLTALNVSSNIYLYDLQCANNQLTALDVSANTSLTTLICGNNNLSALDVSQNILLSTLGCINNHLTSLDVSKNSQIATLVCASNSIATLDCSTNNALTFFDCSDNQLTSLNIKNGVNNNLTFFSAAYNPNLTCIQVDDPAYMNAHWGGFKDATANYNDICTACISYNASLAISAGSSSSICAGGNMDIVVNISNASATSSYFDVLYSDGNNSISNRYLNTGSDISIPVNVAPSSTTQYALISVTDSYGCTAIIQDTFATITVNPLLIFYHDADGDGYGDPNSFVESCEQPAGYVTNNTDCNDGDNTIFPNAPELCDGKDNNCNGQTDEGCTTNISINDVSIKEGNKGQKTLRFTVSLNRVSATKVKVNYTTQNGTATAPGDFIAKSGTLTIKPGKLSATIGILVNGDKIAEADETFSVVLSNAVNATISKATGTGTILNDDKTSLIASSVANNSFAKQHAGIMPNPANSLVNINLTGFAGIVTVQIISIEGKVVQQQKQQTGNGFNAQMQLNVSDLKAGLYLVLIADEKGNRTTEKLVIQH